jgi:hypothetical protein
MPPNSRRPFAPAVAVLAVLVTLTASACVMTQGMEDELFGTDSPPPASSATSATAAAGGGSTAVPSQVPTADPGSSDSFYVDASAPATPPVQLFTNANINGVTPGATVPSRFTVGPGSVHVVTVLTYHYVLPAGVPSTGQVSLTGPDGTVYGPWSTIGLTGQGDIANASWQADVDLLLPAGTYTVTDSDPATWSANEGTAGAGMYWIMGYPIAP